MALWKILVAGALLATSVQAKQKVVYGDDDRLDVYQETNTLFLELARSTAAMMSSSRLSAQGDMYEVTGSRLQDRGICSDALFSQQVTAARCSGFLVGDDLLVTAGHCVKTQTDCDNFKWVFDFAVDEDGENNPKLPKSSVYGCAEIIERDLDSWGTKDDYALIRLDRKVDDRRPLQFRTTGKVELGTELLVIGHPTGLPTKIAAGAYVRGNGQDKYFVSNLDTFGGNSGSAVFDAETGVVEGILVRGETDYAYDRTRSCQVPKQCSNEGCRGEDVTRITNISALMNL